MATRSIVLTTVLPDLPIHGLVLNGNPEFSNLRHYDPNPRSVKQPATRTPMFELLMEQIFNVHQSSTVNGIGLMYEKKGGSDNQDALPDDADGRSPTPLPEQGLEVVAEKTNHVTPDNWQRFCRFAKFDPAVCDAKAQFVLPRFWNTNRHPDGTYKHIPFATQWFAACFFVCNMLQGKPINIMGVDMGLGKTTMALLTALIGWELQHRYKMQRTPDVPWAISHPPAEPIEHDPIFDENWGNPADLLPEGDDRLVVKHGPPLFVITKDLVDHWIKEFCRCIRTPKIKLVLMHNLSEKRFRKDAALFEGVLTPKSFVPKEDLPDIEELRATMDDEQIADIERAGGCHVDTLLFAGSQSDRLGPWMKDYWVLVVKGSKVRQSLTYNTDKPKDMRGIDTHWSMIFVDEMHQSKSVTAHEWNAFSAQVLCNPTYILMSATPYSNPIELVSKWQAITCWMLKMKDVDHDDVSAARILKMSPKEFLTSKDIRIADEIAADPTLQNALKESDIRKVRTPIVKMAGLIAGGRAPTHTDEQEFRQAAALFGTWVCDKMLLWSKDMSWDPTESGTPMSPVPIPPHSTWWISNQPTPDSQYEKDCEAEWDRMRTTADDKMAFLAACARIQPLLLFHCLLTLMTESDQLRKELGNMSIEIVEKMIKRANEHGFSCLRLWGTMSAIDQLPAMHAIRRIIYELQTQVHPVYKHGRKVVITAHKPFICFVMTMYFHWLKERGTNRPNEFRPTDVMKQIAVVTSWESGYAAKNRTAIEPFTMGAKEPDKYRPEPFVLIAPVSQIRAGIELPPADAIILLDGTWMPEERTQVLGRVQRNEMSQKAKHTHTWTVVSETNRCDLVRRMSTKGDSVTQMMADIKRAMEEE